MRRLLLDTSAWSALRLGHPGVMESVSSAREVALNTTVIGELLRGFRAGSREERNRAALERFKSSPRYRFLPLDEETAERYAEIVSALSRAATPIPANDCWIAASALQHGLEILTTDRHFTRLPLLAVRCFDPA